jgi:hypothetical protein
MAENTGEFVGLLVCLKFEQKSLKVGLKRKILTV